MLEEHYVLRLKDAVNPEHKYWACDREQWTSIDNASLFSQGEKERCGQLPSIEEWAPYNEAARSEGIEPYQNPPVWTRDVLVLGDPSGIKFLALTGIHRSSKTVINPAEAEPFPSLESARKMARRIDLGAINENNLRTIYTVRLTAQVIEKGETQCASEI